MAWRVPELDKYCPATLFCVAGLPDRASSPTAIRGYEYVRRAGTPSLNDNRAVSCARESLLGSLFVHQVNSSGTCRLAMGDIHLDHKTSRIN
jgi:hypothetical protein